jgi:predicted CoA-binding protein
MKINRGFMFGFAALFVAAMFTLAGCDDGGGGGGGSSKTLASIAITKQPSKTTYTVGDTLDTAGMVVTATYSDGSTAAVTDWKTSGFDSSRAAASQTVTVSYTEGDVTKTATFPVTINAASGSTPGGGNGGQTKTLESIAITTPPSKTAYTVGDTLDTAGMVVTATYSDGSTAEVTGVPSGFDSSAAAASQTVTVSYTEGGVTKTATFTVTINAASPAKTLASIAITTPPSKTAYTVGEVLDLAGMAVTATYSDGSTAAVTGYTPSGFNSSAAAASQTVTVSYTEGGVTKTATFTVTINAASGGEPPSPPPPEPTGNIAITLPDPSGRDPITAADLSFSADQPANGYNTDFTVTLNTSTTGGSFFWDTDTVSSYQWLIDGAVVQTGTSSSFTVSVSELHSGGHSVTVIIVRDGRSYSATQSFKVQ